MSLPSRGAGGVYNEIKPLSDAVSARTSCAEKSRCAGVAFRFQVIENSVPGAVVEILYDAQSRWQETDFALMLRICNRDVRSGDHRAFGRQR